MLRYLVLVIASLLLLALESYSFQIKLETIHLTLDNLQYNSKKFQGKFPNNRSQPVTAIDFNNVGTTVDGFKKLLQYNLTDLKQLNMTQVRMTDELFALITSQPFFNKLDVLIMNQCSLRSSDFKLFQNIKDAQWKYLDFSKNYIDRQGFERLGRIKMNLTTLKLNTNFLNEDEAVNSLISLGMGNLEYLYIQRTSITPENALKIISHCDTEKLVNISIGHNYYPASFYKQIVKFSFPKLKNLNLDALLLDQDSLPYFTQWKLPSLQVLVFSNNLFRTSQAKVFFTKQIMPNLHTIELNFNPLDEEIFSHFKEEKFVFKKITCIASFLKSKVFRDLAQMDLSEMQVLDIPSGIGMPDDMKYFFEQHKSIPNLKALNLMDYENLGNIFTYLLNTDLPKLEQVNLIEPGQISLQLISKKSDHFPSLKTLQIDLSSQSISTVIDFILKSKQFAPKLEKLKINIYDQYQDQLQEAIRNQTFSSIKGKLQLDAFSGLLIVILENQSKPKPKTMDFPYLMQLRIKKLLEERDDLQPSKLQTYQNEIKNSFFKQYNYSELTHLTENGLMFLVNQLIGPSQHQQPNFLLQLWDLTIRNLGYRSLKSLEGHIFPTLVSVTMMASEEFETKFERKIVGDLNLTNLRHLSYLRYYGSYIKPDLCLWIFEHIQFQRLVSLKINAAGLNETSFGQLKKQLKNYERFNSLDLSNNQLRNLSQIFDPDMKLQALSIGSNPIGSNIVQLCNIDYSFLQQFQLSNCGIDDQSFIKYLDCIANKTKRPFLTLKVFDLGKNVIQTNGVKKLFDLGMPLLVTINFEGNLDFDLFNNIFNSEFSRRIAFFTINNNRFDSISATIPPKNTRRMIDLQIISEDLRDVDLQNIGRLELDQLTDVVILMKRIGDCETLKTLIKLSKNAKQISYILLEPLPSLNDNCINEISSQPYFNNITPEFLQVVVDSSHYLSLQKFQSAFINQNQNLKQFWQYGPGCSNQQKMLDVLDTLTLTNLKYFEAINCEFTDDVIKKLFNKSLPSLQALSLDSNQLLTGEALSTMHGEYSQLQQLDLSHTYIGDKGLQYLITNNVSFPQLQRLTIIDTDITREGILHLNKLKAPKLAMIDLSCNDLPFDDLVMLDLSYEKFPRLQMIVLYPKMSQKIKEKLLPILNRKRASYAPINIATDIEYINDEKTAIDPNTDNSQQNNNKDGPSIPNKHKL